MRAGAYDRRIVILAPVETTDPDFGGVVESYEPLPAIWARYLPGAGSEKYAAGGTYAETDARFLVRWRGDVTTSHRLAFDGREWDILSTAEIGRREDLEIRAKARA